MNNENQYNYTYSAKDRAEIKQIREKYSPKEENKMEHLRRLDASVTRKGTIVSLVVGIISSLILGFGMSCCMVWGDTLFTVGIVVGIIGLIGVGISYPLYVCITKKERERLAPEILRLTDELLK